MLKLRLRRTGAKKQPAYRLVVAESTAPRDGTFLENLGHYNPLTHPTTFVINEERRNLLVFQSGGSPSVVVKIEESDQHDDQWEITILRSPFPFPKPDEGLATVAEGQPGKPPVKGEPRPAAKPVAPVLPAPNTKEPE